MAGLLDFLPEMDKSTAIGLLAAGSQMMNTPRQQGGMGTIGNGLLGFAQGLLAQKQQEKEDARQAQQDARQSRLDDASIAKDNAMIQHYQAQPSGGDPYWTTISTPQGLQKFNARTGEMIQITDPQGNPIMKASDSPDLQGAIAGNKSRNAEAWKPDTIKNTNGSETRGLGKDLYNGLNSGLPRKVLQDGQYHDLADYIPIAQQFVPNIMSVESGGNPNAVSETGAQGLMQVIPSTGRDPGYNVIPLRNKSSDENVRFGTDYFAAMLKKNGGDVQAALRDYNGNSDPRYVEKVMNASPTDKIIAASQPLTQNAQTGIEIAVQNGANPKQATENVVKSLNQTVDNLKRNNVYTGQSTADKLALETEARKTQDQNKANIDLSGKQAEVVQKRTNSANNVVGLLDKAQPLIETATNSGAGALVDDAMGFFGKSTQGANSAQALKALGANLVMQMPRMEGPQSDKDVQLYKEMAGQISDPWIPKARKIAALQTIKDIQGRYLSQSTPVQQTTPNASNSGWSIKAVE